MNIADLTKRAENLVFNIGQQAPYKDLHTDALLLLKGLYGLEQQASVEKSTWVGDEELAEVKKAERKLPLWSNNPNSLPAKILSVYFYHRQQQPTGVITEGLLEEAFKKLNDDPVAFKRNFSQMKNFAEKNHAKIFEVQPNGNVIIWPPVEKLVQAYHKAVFGQQAKLLAKAYPAQYKPLYSED